MQVAMLGALEVRGEDGPIAIDSPKERAILEVLALHAPDVVPIDTLVLALWAEDPPPSAPKTLQSHVSRLRTALRSDTIATEGAGYLLGVDPESIDLHRFEALVHAGHQALQGGESEWAIELIDDALALWRGPALLDVADSPGRTAERARLEEMRSAALQDRIDAHLRLGEHEEMVPELEALVAENPLNEALWERLVLALYRSDRPADALGAHRRMRRLLREELGLDPSPRLAELELLVLDDDPSLLAPPRQPRRSLPTPLTSFVGRVEQTREVLKLLRNHRLVTVLGPGGVGKSRLALEVARLDANRHPDGTWWVDLTHLEQADDLIGELVGALRVVVPPGMATAEALWHFLSARRLLLVLDNAERVAEELGRHLTEVLESAPGTSVLVTSRAPLGTPGENRYVLPPLETEKTVDDAGTSESVRLFEDRFEERSGTTGSRRDLAAMGTMCRLVDGLPLAIEVAAASAAAIGVERTLDQLRAHRGLPDPSIVEQSRIPGATRQPGLLAVLSSTVDLLDTHQRRLLCLLSVFRSSFEERAAQAVADSQRFATDLGRLRDLSLVVTVDEPGRGRRLRLLDTTRAFAEGLGAEPELADAARRHAAYFRKLARAAGPAMDGPDEPRVVERLQIDEANIVAAINWYLENDPPRVLGLARSLGRVWFVRGDLAITARRLTRMLEAARAAGATDPVDTGWLLIRLSWPQFLTGEFEAGMATMEEAAGMLEGTDEHVGLSLALAGRAHMILLATGDTDAALELYRRGIEHARRAGRESATAWALAEAAQALTLADRVDSEVEDMIAEAEASFAAAEDHFGLSHVCMDRLLAAYAQDDLDAARQACEEGIAHQRAAGNRMYEQILHLGLGVGQIHLGATEKAAPEIAEGIRLAEDAHNLAQLGIALQAASVLAAAEGDAGRAARLRGAAGTLGPVWPLFERRYGELLAPARAELGDAWDAEVAAGSALTPDEAVRLATR